ncbi:hypothetical protein VDG1235_675 [Verrucomicrobiia bacterium DG1235]|nr:hypothetical protein VDG1235_675 [Verrucomicrobiae bacterium DG1235]
MDSIAVLDGGSYKLVAENDDGVVEVAFFLRVLASTRSC